LLFIIIMICMNTVGSLPQPRGLLLNADLVLTPKPRPRRFTTRTRSVGSCFIILRSDGHRFWAVCGAISLSWGSPGQRSWASERRYYFGLDWGGLCIYI